MFGNQFETPSWMQELLWRIQRDQQNAQNGNMEQNGESGQQPQAPQLFPEGHSYRRFMKNPLAGLSGDPMAGQKQDGLVPEGHPYRKFMKNPLEGTMPVVEQTPPSKLLPEGHPYRKFMKDPTAGLQPPQKVDRTQEMKNINGLVRFWSCLLIRNVVLSLREERIYEFIGTVSEIPAKRRGYPFL